MAWENLMFDGFDAQTLGKWDSISYMVIQGSGRRGGYAVGALTGYSNSPYITKKVENKKCVLIGAALQSTAVSYRFDFCEESNIQCYCVITNSSIAFYDDMETLLGTASITTQSDYHYFEIAVNIDDIGNMVVKQDGNIILSISDDTQATSNAYCDEIKITININYYDACIDDLYIRTSDIWDTSGFLGDIRIDAIVPTADTSKEFTPSTGTDNYACVDEIPASETDYVTSGTSGGKDIYRFANTLDLPGRILAVQQNSLCKKSSTGDTQGLKHLVKVNGTEYKKSAFTPDSTSAYFCDIWNTNPYNDNEWDRPEINALDAGLIAEV